MTGTPYPPSPPTVPGRPGAPSRPELHVVFAVDVSGSMVGDRIASLNYAVRAALPALRDAAADNPGVAVLIRVLAFGDAAVWPVPTPVPVESFGWTDLAASGETSMGAAFSCLAAALAVDAGRQDAQDAQDARNAPPAVVILLSDGLPTDAVEAPLAAFLRSAQGGRAIRIAIAIGAEADLGLLREFIAEPTIHPLRADDAPALVERIRWAATVPVRAAAGTAGMAGGGEDGRPVPAGALAGGGVGGEGVGGEGVAEDLTW